jgi:hypothetical protein
MPKVELDVETPLPPERVKDALLDFSPRRPEIWPDIEPSLYEVYAVHETSADVKEGSKTPIGVIWAKEHYDWSVPNIVKWTVQESNFCTPGSYVAARIDPNEGAGSRIHIVWERTGVSLRGRLIVTLVKQSKGKPIAASVKKAFDRLAQNRP